MIPNRFAFIGLAIACVAAAAGGGYLATRQNAVPAPVAATASQGTAPSTGAAARPVQETEAVVGEPAKGADSSILAAPVASTSTQAPAPASTAPQARRTEPPLKARSAARTEARNRSSAPQTLDRPWPSSAATQGPQTQTESPAPPARADERSAPEPARTPEPPQPAFQELTVAAESVMGLQIESTISSERARVEDRVEARFVRDMRVNGQVAVPAGTRAIGSVTVVERGGKFKERAKLGIRFHTLVLADGTRMPMTTDTLYRYGDSPANGSAAKIGGGAVAGAILGAILGGAKGAAVGATAGAGGGTAAVMAGDPSAAVFAAGSEVNTRLLAPVTVTVER
jgi:hypothetical protein